MRPPADCDWKVVPGRRTATLSILATSATLFPLLCQRLLIFESSLRRSGLRRRCSPILPVARTPQGLARTDTLNDHDDNSLDCIAPGAVRASPSQSNNRAR